MPVSLGPLVIGITGGGAVASGVRHVIEALDDVLEWVEPSALEALDTNFSTHKVYATQIMPEHIYERIDGTGTFDLDDYFAQGAKVYRSTFASKVRQFFF